MKNTSGGEPSVIHVLPTGKQSNNKHSRNPIQNSSSSVAGHIEEREINRQEQNPISYWSSLYVFPILGACIIFSSTQTLIPWHNLFISPEYWWEELIRSALFYMPFRIVLPTAREAYCVFQLKEILTIAWHLKFWIAHVSEWITLCCLQHLLWVVIYENNYPMPSGYALNGFIAWYITIFLILPRLFPRQLRADPKFKTRLNNYVYYQFFWSIIAFQEYAMDMIFETLKAFQVPFLMAIVIPAFRRLVEWILPKFFNKAVGYKKGWTKRDENEAATFCLETLITQVYTIYVAVRLSSADILTGCCILGVELLINLYSCIQIIQMHKKVGGTNEYDESLLWTAERNSSMVSLLTAELIEVLSPLAYSLALSMAYYGPNATIMTGIKNEYFGIPAITDIREVLNVLSMMVLIDLAGGICFGILLKYFCKVNIFEEMCKILQKYWIHLAIFIGGDLTHVSCSNAILIKCSIIIYYTHIFLFI